MESAQAADDRAPAVIGAAVIGAGPAGLFAALRLKAALRDSGRSEDVRILERRDRPARKLLLSGSGQCNLTHEGSAEEFLRHYAGGSKPGQAARFLKPALYGFDNGALLAWFQARGLEFECTEAGKYFPRDRRAASVLGVLLAEADRLGLHIESGRRVRALSRDPATGEFLLLTEASGAAPASPATEVLRARTVLLATGGASYPRTGSSGDGYALAAAFGHRIVPPRPALAPVRNKDLPVRDHAGLSFRSAGLVLRRDGEKALEREGELIITHEGLSGPLILDVARWMKPGDHIDLRFAAVGSGEFRTLFDRSLAAAPRRLARSALGELGLPKSLADRLYALSGLDPALTAAELSRPARETLRRLACAFPLEVEALGSWNEAMATAGGIALDEVDPRTMESRLVPGLFFAGELLDLDGETGGYNLQAAFSTADRAASGMAAALYRLPPQAS